MGIWLRLSLKRDPVGICENFLRLGGHETQENNNVPKRRKKMKQTKWVVCSVLAFSILSTAGVIFAEDKEAKSPAGETGGKLEKKKAPDLNPQGKKMVKVCKLNEEQADKLAKVMKINKLKLKKFKNAKATNSEKTNAVLMRELTKKMRDAWKTKNKETYKALKKQFDPPKKEENRIKQENKEQILSILTDKQKYDWAGYIGGWMSSRQLKRLGVALTDEQKARFIKLIGR